MSLKIGRQLSLMVLPSGWSDNASWTIFARAMGACSISSVNWKQATSVFGSHLWVFVCPPGRA